MDPSKTWFLVQGNTRPSLTEVADLGLVKALVGRRRLEDLLRCLKVRQQVLLIQPERQARPQKLAPRGQRHQSQDQPSLPQVLQCPP